MPGVFIAYLLIPSRCTSNENRVGNNPSRNYRIIVAIVNLLVTHQHLLFYVCVCFYSFSVGKVGGGGRRRAGMVWNMQNTTS